MDDVAARAVFEPSGLTRIERDSVGAIEVPEAAYYGVHTLRAVENFPITARAMHPALTGNIVRIKRAAARANAEAGVLAIDVAEAIERACDEVLSGALCDQFIVDQIQGGAGTSANMNANEVIANRALELMGYKKGDYAHVHPNDHVNLGQSTNDVYPTAGRMTAYQLLGKLEASLSWLCEALRVKAREFDDVVKMGRTQLEDAVPVRLGQSFAAYESVLRRDLARIETTRRALCEVNLGGTAIGTALNAAPVYLERVLPILSAQAGIPLTRAKNMIDATQNTDAFTAASGVLKTCALNLSKIANDLRLLSSGPRTGIGEIVLPARQNGSSIMPGKINPVIPEVVNQVAFLVAGNDVTIAMASEAGQLELNAFEPVMFCRLFESIECLAHAADTFEKHCVSGITANREHCLELVRHSAGLVTALCPVLGYVKAAEIAKEALRTGRPIADVVQAYTGLPAGEIEAMLDLRAMTEMPPAHSPA
ncbi:MAG: aspartate ammonia-lyase [Christensenellaceae bacterium]|nr:aspartate ammonia-lyase [Christensenellaceae bacterium]MEA5067889.1 aspartate ammonia-lyase [Christensenellaceae bacterium]